MGASESKLAFKEDIFHLAIEPDIPATDQRWARYYQLPESAEDIFTLWTANDLRTLMQTTSNNTDHNRVDQQSPPSSPSLLKKNVETLIYTCVARLESIQKGSVTSISDVPLATEILNCMRMLTRILPYIYEKDELSDWEDQFFWQPRRATTMWDHENHRPGPKYDGLSPKTALSADKADEPIDVPLGEKLIDLLVGYLFFQGFTLPKQWDEQGKPVLGITYQIWQSGIGARQSKPLTKENESNAMETLRLLLSLCSRTIYLGSNMLAISDIKPLTYLTTQLTRQATLSIICSLMNTVLKYNPATWRISKTVDWTGLNKDPKQQLVTLALQLMLVMTIYQPPSGDQNQIRKSLGRLHRVEDFQFIHQGLTMSLNQPVSGFGSYLPSPQKALPWAAEMLQMFWELLQCNKRFRAFIIDTDRVHDSMIITLYYAVESKDDPSRQGIVRMCIFILQTLSVEPSFGTRLNKELLGQETLPAILKISNFHGSYADYLISTIHSMITSTRGRLEPMYPALLAIINNIAPHIVELQRATSVKLMDLFIQFSAPSFVLANETNHTLLISLMDSINAVLEHQYSANRRFVDVIVASQQRVFAAQRKLTVDGALDELDRAARERKERGEALAGSLTSHLTSHNPSASGANPPLNEIPENSAFAIGDDEEEEDDDLGHETSNWQDAGGDGRRRSSGHAGGSAAASVTADDDIPPQSRSISEKARGKQPVGQGHFTRTTSRTTSTTSLDSASQTGAAPSAPQLCKSSPQHGFEPTPDWLSSWTPFLPFHPLITTIEFENAKTDTQRLYKESQSSAYTRAGANADGALSSTPATPGASSPGDGTADHANPSNRPGFHDATIKVQSFSWSPLALGWYTSMLWSWIYAGDTAAYGHNGTWVGTRIRAFNVITAKEKKITLRDPRGAVDAAGNAIAQKLGAFSVGGSTREV